jgi:hypothetical protein
MFRKIKTIYYNIKNGISNIIRWIPVIWQLRDWDAGYLYVLIYKHLTHVESCLKNYGHGVNSPKYAKQVQVAKNLAKRLNEDDYLSNALIPVKQKYGEAKIHFEKCDNGQWWRMINDEPVENTQARHNAYEHEKYMKNQDKKLLFQYLYKYIDQWWD